MFRSGDQDYDSAIGWAPKTRMDELRDAARKKNPLLFAPDPNMLTTRTASAWLESGTRLPPREQLFGPFWLRYELAVLFAGTGAGKSVLATQIGESLARGVPIDPFARDGMVDRPMTVLYLDFEQTQEQFAMRYSCVRGAAKTFEKTYSFSPTLHRSEFAWDGDIIEGYSGFSEMFFTNITNVILGHRADALVVDNVVTLDRGSLASSSIALSVMRSLVKLKRCQQVSILVLTHTPKRRASQPLTERDLQGSINLANFADSVFAVGRSRQDRDWRYLKQIKVRTGRTEFDAEHVPVFSLGKFDSAAKLGLVQNPDRPPVENFLGFDFVKFDREENHIELRHPVFRRRPTPKELRSETVASIKKLAAEGKSARQIAGELGISKSTSNRHMPKEVNA